MMHDTVHRSELLSALLVEQGEGWTQGVCPPVEEYVARYPGLADDPPALFKLIFAEVSLRQARGQTPDVAEYASRFPVHESQLREQWDWFMAGMPGPATPPKAPSTLPVAPPRRLPSLPGFDLIGEVGRGGMGVVYKARQHGLEREVAIKFFPLGLGAGDEWLGRFQAEARAVGQLDHPGVVRVHQCGEHAGQPFLVMEYVPGGSLSGRLKDGPLGVRESAELIRDVARAVQTVHEAGIIHRDLKPGNILLTAEGKPKVADFGLAKLLDGGGDLTGSDRAMGTPQYMSPEQAAGQTREAGPAADVWALGATMFVCLAGRPPFRGETTAAILREVREGEPLPLRKVCPADLEAVVLKCLEKEPTRRFATAGELADELERWLNGEGVRTRPPGALGRAVRWVRRHPRRAFLAAAVGAVPAALVGGFWTWGVDWLDEELKKGKGAKLFDRGGWPRSLRWAAGNRPPRLEQSADHAFRFEANNPILAELAPTPRLTAFRYQVQVRHDRSINSGMVGLFFGRRTYHVADRAVHLFGFLGFNDVISNLALWEAKVKADRKFAAVPRPGPNPLRLGFSLYPPGGAEQDTPVFGHVDKHVVQAHGLNYGPWRTLAVEVTGERIRAYWGPEDGGTPSLVLTASVEELLAHTADACGLKPRGHLAREVQPVFGPEGGVGVFVHLGAASFRAATITRL